MQNSIKNKEGYLQMRTGLFSAWQKNFILIDYANAFFSYGVKKDSLFKSSSFSETIPACIIADVFANGEKGITLALSNKRKVELRADNSDDARLWIDAFFSLSTTAPSRTLTRDGISLDAPGDRVRITFQTPSNLTSPSGSPLSMVNTKEYHAMFVACDPGSLTNAMKMSVAEESVFNPLLRYTFHTTLVKAKAPAQLTPFESRGRVVPSIQRKMDGNFYAFRNETLKQFGAGVQTDTYWLATYQILDHHIQMSEEDMGKLLVQNLNTFEWFPYKEYEIAESFHTPYFPHYNNEDLVRGLPWKLIDLQGSLRTIYINGSTCFESVLHIWQYHEMLFNQTDAPMILPADRTAPLAIIGAGPSGLLMAVRLSRMGYTNIDIIEASDRVGGKSVTVIKDSPSGPVVCELGTCYMSSDYDQFRSYFGEFIGEEQGVPDVVDRTIVTLDEFKKMKVDDLKIFTDYALAKAMEENDMIGFKNLTRADVLYDFYKYSELHDKIFDGERPFPRNQPKELLGELGKQSYNDFLRSHGMESLFGLLQYAYQAQGYGSLHTVPAFYGLVWITPSMIYSMFMDIIITTLNPNLLPETITYIKNGWGSVWENVLKKNQFNVHYNAKVTLIERPATL